jgi:hypothetical protein
MSDLLDALQHYLSYFGLILIIIQFIAYITVGYFLSRKPQSSLLILWGLFLAFNLSVLIYLSDLLGEKKEHEILITVVNTISNFLSAISHWKFCWAYFLSSESMTRVLLPKSGKDYKLLKKVINVGMQLSMVIFFPTACAMSLAKWSEKGDDENGGY